MYLVCIFYFVLFSQFYINYKLFTLPGFEPTLFDLKSRALPIVPQCLLYNCCSFTILNLLYNMKLSKIGIVTHDVFLNVIPNKEILIHCFSDLSLNIGKEGKDVARVSRI